VAQVVDVWGSDVVVGEKFFVHRAALGLGDDPHKRSVSKTLDGTHKWWFLFRDGPPAFGAEFRLKRYLEGAGRYEYEILSGEQMGTGTEGSKHRISMSQDSWAMDGSVGSLELYPGYTVNDEYRKLLVNGEDRGTVTLCLGWRPEGGTKIIRGEYYRDGQYFVTETNDNNFSVGVSSMQGNVYDAAVIQTKHIPAGAGLTTSVQVSEVVFAKNGFVASSDEAAKATVIFEAQAQVRDLNPNDPISPIEVKLRKW
jgi:hypothetical protein